MAECPICGYQFAPFETKCPRCEEVVKRSVGVLGSAPPARARPRGSGPGLWIAVGVVAALVLLATGVVWYASRGPVQPGPSALSGLGSGAPRPTAPAEGGMGAPAGTQYGSEAVAPAASDSAQPSPEQAPQNLVQECPFSPVVGQGLRTNVGGDYHANWDGERITDVEMGGWKLQAVGDQGLQLEGWPDQPFDLYKDGQLVGSYNSTAEYWSARE